MLARHRRRLTLATPCLPLDEAIVTVPVRPSVTKQAGSSRQAGPSSTAKVPVLIGTRFQSKLLPTPGSCFSANFLPRLTYHLHVIRTRVACSQSYLPYTVESPFLLQHPQVTSTCLLPLQYEAPQGEPR